MSTRIPSWLPESAQAELQDPTKAAQYEQGQEFLRNMIQRSATDESFRRQLLTTPREAIASHYTHVYGEKAEGTPPNLDIRFVENTGDMTLVLPPFVDSEAELSDAELQTVAGGDGGISAGIVAAAVVSNMWCLGFAAGVATVALIAFAVSD